jgi:hypothetical protein
MRRIGASGALEHGFGANDTATGVKARGVGLIDRATYALPLAAARRADGGRGQRAASFARASLARTALVCSSNLPVAI